MSRYCLDSSAYSHMHRGDPQVVDIVDGAKEVGVPSIVLGEIRAGSRTGRFRDRNEELLADFLADPSVDVLTIDEDVSVHYADIITDLKLAGIPLPTNDVWIAAAAGRFGMTVLTYDNHFNSISRVGSVVLSP